MNAADSEAALRARLRQELSEHLAGQTPEDRPAVCAQFARLADDYRTYLLMRRLPDSAGGALEAFIGLPGVSAEEAPRGLLRLLIDVYDEAASAAR